jgi:hypothetical protein
MDKGRVEEGCSQAFWKPENEGNDRKFGEGVIVNT